MNSIACEWRDDKGQEGGRGPYLVMSKSYSYSYPYIYSCSYSCLYLYPFPHLYSHASAYEYSGHISITCYPGVKPVNPELESEFQNW